MYRAITTTAALTATQATATVFTKSRKINGWRVTTLTLGEIMVIIMFGCD